MTTNDYFFVVVDIFDIFHFYSVVGAICFSISKKHDTCQIKIRNNHLSTTICKQIFNRLKFLLHYIFCEKKNIFERKFCL